MEEIWKIIPDYNDYYMVSNLGNVKSLDRMVINTSAGSKRLHKGDVKKKRKSNSGYLYVGLQIHDKNINHFVHRLVAQAFIPNPENKRYVNHINGIKTDNRVENLEWCTNSENVQHAYKTGLSVNYGTNCHSAVLTNEKVLWIREQYLIGKSITEMGRHLGVCFDTVKKVVERKTWKHL